MPDRGSRWLAAVVAAMLAAQPLVASDVAADETCSGREQISRQLIELGSTADNARNAASRLTAEDVEVLLANPDMMQAAGGAQFDIALGALLLVGLIVALAAAGSTVVIIST